MACATCSSEPVLLASSTAVLTAVAGSFFPLIVPTHFVGYIAKKAPTPLARCRSYQHPYCGCGLSGEPYRLFPYSTVIIHSVARLAASILLHFRKRKVPTGSPRWHLRRAPCRRSFQVR